MTYISLTPTLRYQMLTVTNCLVLPTIACRMHFAEQHTTLDNVYEIDYAEIVSDTPFDTVMQDHCCPEKFYHKVGCSTEPASGTLTGVVG